MFNLYYCAICLILGIILGAIALGFVPDKCDWENKEQYQQRCKDKLLINIIRYKLFFQTRKNAIIFFFGKIMCKLFGHKKPYGERKEIKVDLIESKDMTTDIGILISNRMLPIKICPRCFKSINLWQ